MTTTNARTKSIAGTGKALPRRSRWARWAAALVHLALAVLIASLVTWQVAAFLN